MKKAVQIIVNNAGGIGAYDDERKYKEFFTSLEGGAWREDEILPTMYGPSSAELISHLLCLELEGLEYLVIVFSGHGGLSQDGRNTVLCLAGEGGCEDYDIKDSMLISRTNRRLVILDCCRARGERHPQLLLEGAELIKAANCGADLVGAVRQAYEDAVDATPSDTAVLYACGPLVSTTGADGEGGVFSNKLKDKDYIQRMVLPSYRGYYTVSDAYQAIKDCPDLYSPQIYPPCSAMANLPWLMNVDFFRK